MAASLAWTRAGAQSTARRRRRLPEVVTIYVGWNDLMKRDPAAQAKRGTGSALARALDNWLAKGFAS